MGKTLKTNEVLSKIAYTILKGIITTKQLKKNIFKEVKTKYLSCKQQSTHVKVLTTEKKHLTKHMVHQKENQELFQKTKFATKHYM